MNSQHSKDKWIIMQSTRRNGPRFDDMASVPDHDLMDAPWAEAASVCRTAATVRLPDIKAQWDVTTSAMGHSSGLTAETPSLAVIERDAQLESVQPRPQLPEEQGIASGPFRDEDMESWLQFAMEDAASGASAIPTSGQLPCQWPSGAATRCCGADLPAEAISLSQQDARGDWCNSRKEPSESNFSQMETREKRETRAVLAVLGGSACSQHTARAPADPAASPSPAAGDGRHTNDATRACAPLNFSHFSRPAALYGRARAPPFAGSSAPGVATSSPPRGVTGNPCMALKEEDGASARRAVGDAAEGACEEAMEPCPLRGSATALEAGANGPSTNDQQQLLPALASTDGPGVAAHRDSGGSRQPTARAPSKLPCKQGSMPDGLAMAREQPSEPAVRGAVPAVSMGASPVAGGVGGPALPKLPRQGRRIPAASSHAPVASLPFPPQGTPLRLPLLLGQAEASREAGHASTVTSNAPEGAAGEDDAEQALEGTGGGSHGFEAGQAEGAGGGVAGRDRQSAPEQAGEDGELRGEQASRASAGEEMAGGGGGQAGGHAEGQAPPEAESPAVGGAPAGRSRRGAARGGGKRGRLAVEAASLAECSDAVEGSFRGPADEDAPSVPRGGFPLAEVGVAAGQASASGGHSLRAGETGQSQARGQASQAGTSADAAAGTSSATGAAAFVGAGSAAPPAVELSPAAKRARAAEVHNMSERRRRDRINERMRALQELIPNSNKTDKASMLDEAIEYLKMLQMQLQVMSMRTGISIPPGLAPPGSLLPQPTAADAAHLPSADAALAQLAASSALPTPPPAASFPPAFAPHLLPFAAGPFAPLAGAAGLAVVAPSAVGRAVSGPAFPTTREISHLPSASAGLSAERTAVGPGGGPQFSATAPQLSSGPSLSGDLQRQISAGATALCCHPQSADLFSSALSHLTCLQGPHSQQHLPLRQLHRQAQGPPEALQRGAMPPGSLPCLASSLLPSFSASERLPSAHTSLTPSTSHSITQAAEAGRFYNPSHLSAALLSMPALAAAVASDPSLRSADSGCAPLGADSRPAVLPPHRLQASSHSLPADWLDRGAARAAAAAAAAAGGAGAAEEQLSRASGEHRRADFRLSREPTGSAHHPPPGATASAGRAAAWATGVAGLGSALAEQTVGRGLSDGPLARQLHPTAVDPMEAYLARHQAHRQQQLQLLQLHQQGFGADQEAG